MVYANQTPPNTTTPPVQAITTPLWEHRERMLMRDVHEYLREYIHDRPDVVAMWCFGIGFLFGWKLRR